MVTASYPKDEVSFLLLSQVLSDAMGTHSTGHSAAWGSACMCVHGCYQIITRSVPETTQICYLIWRSEVQRGSHQTKIKGCVPFGGSRGESPPCLFQLLEAAHIPWLMAPSFIFKVSDIGPSLSPAASCPVVRLPPLLPRIRTLAMTAGSPRHARTV